MREGCGDPHISPCLTPKPEYSGVVWHSLLLQRARPLGGQELPVEDSLHITLVPKKPQLTDETQMRLVTSPEWLALLRESAENAVDVEMNPVFRLIDLLGDVGG